MAFIPLLGLAILLSFWILFLNRFGKSSGLPPGPRGFPLIGNILQLIRNPSLKLTQWTNEYGKLYLIKIGNLKTLVVSDAKLMREIFGHPASTGKFKTETILQLTQGPYGIVSNEGKQWYEQRQFSMRSLAQHGFGKKGSMEALILLEIKEVVDHFKGESREGKAVVLQDTFIIAVQNILWTIVTGERISFQNQTVFKLFKDLFDAIHYSSKTGLMFLSWLKYIAPELSGFNKLVRASTKLHAFIKEYFEEHRKTFTPGTPRDVIDSYLEQMDKQAENPSSTFCRDVGMRNSVASIVEIFIAAGDTTSHTMSWLVLYLCTHLDVQAQMHEEIDRVIGNRDPSLKDRPNMPYTEAVILETLRKSSLVHAGIFHQLLEDIEMFGYKFSKGLIILANIYYVHHNQGIWGDPENFRPERFLSGEGSELKVIKNENLIPFQVGKRECFGEPLAKDILFLFVIKLFQTFQFLPETDNPRPSLEPDIGVLLISQPFKVNMRERGSSA